ncbi:Bax inhibitor-1/YccA family protein [Arcanobacterium haemolyticum]|nr:Bax inhibitor-1/YccA family protein [Arcanobacterium haemolyticum]
MGNNPVMSRNPYFTAQASTPNTYPGVPRPQTSAYDSYGNAQYTNQYEQAQYAQPEYGYGQAQPTAFAATGTTMTYDDAMVKTVLLLAATVISGVLTGYLVPLQMMPVVAGGASLVAFGVGMVAAFQRMVKPAFAVAYAVLEGVALGALTFALDAFYPGVAMQAILGTVIVVAVAVGLHMSGTVRTTPKGRRIALTVMIAAIIFGFINMLLVWFGVLSDWGMRSGGLGIVIGLVMIAIAGYMLISDLELIKMAVANNAPREFAWTCAFGIVMTILWIYVEVLRLAAIFASDNR